MFDSVRPDSQLILYRYFHNTFIGWEDDLRSQPYMYYGMVLKVDEIQPSCSIQVTVYDKEGIEHDALTGQSLFTSTEDCPRPEIDEVHKDDDKCIYIMTLDSADRKLDCGIYLWEINESFYVL